MDSFYLSRCRVHNIGRGLLGHCHSCCQCVSTSYLTCNKPGDSAYWWAISHSKITPPQHELFTKKFISHHVLFLHSKLDVTGKKHLVKHTWLLTRLWRKVNWLFSLAWLFSAKNILIRYTLLQIFLLACFRKKKKKYHLALTMPDHPGCISSLFV